MQTNQEPTESQNFDKQVAESTLHDATCCASFSVDGGSPPSVKTLMLLPRVGSHSLVGIYDTDYPIKFGNYCSIAEGPYLCNMWAENLEEWARRNPTSGPIEITEYNHAGRSLGLVTDERLRDWCNPRPCVTGHGWPSVAVMRLVCAAMGASTDNRSCGCEKDDERPSISEIWMPGHSWGCARCGRKWKAEDPD